MTETPAGPAADAEAPAATEATPESSTAAELEREAAELSVRSLLEAGAHFGHQTQRWNPKMKPFIFGNRNGTHIIDLDQTLTMFAEALEFLREICAEGGSVLFVGTKRQSATSVETEALRAEQYYVNNRWLGGMLTNWKTVKKSIDRYKTILETLGDEERKAEFSKKELSRLSRLGEKYRKSLHGIREMGRLPSALFVIDVSKEQIAVSEARRLGIPIVAMVDSNCNPDGIDFVVPANDDAIRAVDLYCRLVADACIEGARIHNERIQSETHAQPAAGPGIGRRVVEIKQAPRRSRSQQGVTSGRTQSAGGRTGVGEAAPAEAPRPEAAAAPAAAEAAAAPAAKEDAATPTDGES
jgi:small subunit ribosomal protein S2